MPDVPPMTITQVEAVYARWLHDGDRVTTRVFHAAYVANMMLPGDPVWVFLVGGSGQGKTERLTPLNDMPHVVLASTLSGEAALLSATARRDRAEHAHGGLLRRVGAKGVLIVKDFTSILEMDRTARGKVLAALREVYDGRWDREVGAEGGQTLTWQGKCGFLAACTTTIDKAHAVMNDMGPRSLFVRLPPADLVKIAGSALDHMGHEQAMRKELATLRPDCSPISPASPHEPRAGPGRADRPRRPGVAGPLASAPRLERRGRARRRRRGADPDHQAARPALARLRRPRPRPARILGSGRRCALDSIPKLRGAVIRYLAGWMIRQTRPRSG